MIDELDFCRIQEHADPIAALDRKPQTNADRIRAMSDEELAAFHAPSTRGCPPQGKCRGSIKKCYDCWLDWLKQEVKT